ncbi:MAG TPA: PP2C family protein-serine/threonine phosphatase [Leptospiraceae bacterium]|nr:PP2C family protein-serine/threonine phosphatase [Leptospiraceae bacterium]HMW05988.1 PP2C family protein-serine/threonine phosphatase [Leptospiraceae bacterium]HMX32080.1 PP2C family protein-serine/threonine phosphatase [Leptospiraceae bacterium]HMY32342.1 PP2C family protein-serine/threonine phosphatase [Leptospiraceae bacterium]HMZ62456.1 PP2C family protein-serine/threonine phosphatase [Leptospiraceae bacterium]
MILEWKSYINRYTFYGSLFGLLFPFFSTILQSYSFFQSIDIELLLLTQKNTPLLWIIDTAPFFLGLLAGYAGGKQITIKNALAELMRINREMKIEIIRSNTMETNLQDMISTYKQDLHSAKLVQEFSLPKIPKMNECNISYKYIPLNPVGGDFLSIVKFPDGKLGLLIGDVVGHGISAALIAALAYALSYRAREYYSLSPKSYLEYLNNEAEQYLGEDYYFTALYGFIEFQNNKAFLTFSRGGHPYPFIYRKEKRITEIYQMPGSPLGLMRNLSYEQLTIELNSGDKIFWITDGFIEIRNVQEKILGNDGLAEIIKESCEENQDIHQIIDGIISRSEAFANGAAYNDDRLILGIDIL